jgi:hypothetical protein
MFTNFSKISLLTAMCLLFAVYVSSANLPDYISNYNCSQNIVSQTGQIDTDNDSLYDTYTIHLCEESQSRTLPIKSLIDISKWPPLGVPNRSIAAELVNDSLLFLETYFDFNGSILGWFQKFQNNDTVYFHGGDSYNPTDFAYDSSAFYIQTYPNPASDIMNIHYVVKASGMISLQFLTYEGQLLSNIFTMPSGQGEYNMVFNLSSYAEGYYKLKYTTGSNNYIISVAIMR